MGRSSPWSCHTSHELSPRLCPARSVQGLSCQGPAGYHCGHYLHSPPLRPGLWCPLEEPHTHLSRGPSCSESDPVSPTHFPPLQQAGPVTFDQPSPAQSNIFPQRTRPCSLGAPLPVGTPVPHLLGAAGFVQHPDIPGSSRWPLVM